MLLMTRRQKKPVKKIPVYLALLKKGGEKDMPNPKGSPKSVQSFANPDRTIEEGERERERETRRGGEEERREKREREERRKEILRRIKLFRCQTAHTHTHAHTHTQVANVP